MGACGLEVFGVIRGGRVVVVVLWRHLAFRCLFCLMTVCRYALMRTPMRALVRRSTTPELQIQAVSKPWGQHGFCPKRLYSTKYERVDAALQAVVTQHAKLLDTCTPLYAPIPSNDEGVPEEDVVERHSALQATRVQLKAYIDTISDLHKALLATYNVSGGDYIQELVKREVAVQTVLFAVAVQ